MVWIRLIAVEVASGRFYIYFEGMYCEGFADEFSIRDDI